MKKVSLIAAAAIMATSVLYAQEPPKPTGPEFKFSGEAYAYGLVMSEAHKPKSGEAVNYNYAAYRFRPFMSAKTENVEATIRLEIDQFFGSKQGSDGKNSDSSYADVGDDEKGDIEIKAAFLKFNVPTVSGLWAKAGVDAYKTVGGFVLGTEVAGGFIGFKGSMADATFGCAKLYENNYALKNDDRNLGIIDVSLKPSENLTLRPAIYAISVGKNSYYKAGYTEEVWNSTAGDFDTVVHDPVIATFAGQTAYVPSMGIELKMDAFSFVFAGSYGMCDKDELDKEYAAYAFDVNPSLKLGSDIKIDAFFTMLSGDDDATDKDATSFTNFEVMWDGFGRMYLLEYYSKFSNIGKTGSFDARQNAYGYMLAGASVAYKASPFEAKVAVAWAQTAAEQKNDDNFERSLGTEIDAMFAYEVEKNAQIILECAYLMGGKHYGYAADVKDGVFNGINDTENAYLVALGMAYKW